MTHPRSPTRRNRLRSDWSVLSPRPAVTTISRRPRCSWTCSPWRTRSSCWANSRPLTPTRRAETRRVATRPYRLTAEASRPIQPSGGRIRRPSVAPSPTAKSNRAMWVYSLEPKQRLYIIPRLTSDHFFLILSSFRVRRSNAQRASGRAAGRLWANSALRATLLCPRPRVQVPKRREHISSRVCWVKSAHPSGIRCSSGRTHFWTPCPRNATWSVWIRDPVKWWKGMRMMNWYWLSIIFSSMWIFIMRAGIRVWAIANDEGWNTTRTGFFVRYCTISPRYWSCWTWRRRTWGRRCVDCWERATSVSSTARSSILFSIKSKTSWVIYPCTARILRQQLYENSWV